MKKQGIGGYEWSQNVDLSAFKSMDYYNEKPKINDVVKDCET